MFVLSIKQMNNFEPQEIKKASQYLQDKLNLFKKYEQKSTDKKVYIVENKKASMVKRFVGSIFSK